MECSAVVSPASPMTYAVPPGRWLLRNSAVASALVQIDSSGTSIPLRDSLACRSRAVKIELLVRSRNGISRSRNRRTKSAAPGIARSSWTSTPSMSDSHAVTGLEGSVMASYSHRAAQAPLPASGPGRRLRLEGVALHRNDTEQQAGGVVQVHRSVVAADHHRAESGEAG